jgi:hypothetical protein
MVAPHGQRQHRSAQALEGNAARRWPPTRQLTRPAATWGRSGCRWINQGLKCSCARLTAAARRYRQAPNAQRAINQFRRLPVARVCHPASAPAVPATTLRLRPGGRLDTAGPSWPRPGPLWWGRRLQLSGAARNFVGCRPARSYKPMPMPADTSIKRCGAMWSWDACEQTLPGFAHHF